MFILSQLWDRFFWFRGTDDMAAELLEEPGRSDSVSGRTSNIAEDTTE